MTRMTPERWQRVTALLDEVLGCELERRDSLLSERCGTDEELRREVESLLRYEQESVSLLEEPLAPGSSRPIAQESSIVGQGLGVSGEVGLRIGPYRVIRRLGGGGMGNVYLAAREDDFHQRVALKRIKRRDLSEELRFRFENERQILADLTHPNIARILDAGQTEDGLPYFTMEYVRGVPIDEYCDRHRLTVRQRLELVLKVCSALQLAHQNLVIHRDLKPSNILVTRDGIPKLIDFGIAKHLAPDSLPHDVATRLGTQPMTLKYASPEQLWGLPSTTAADIYSLGVLIYQLLTGHAPYPYKASLIAMHHAICEQDPIKPSQSIRRLSAAPVDGYLQDQPVVPTSESVSSARSTPPERLASALTGDLDSILLKALRKQPENRYRSVEQLADDLRRHLDGLPVNACEGTFRYLAGKYARRHAYRLMAVGLALAMVLAAGLTMFTLWQRALREEAEQARAKAEWTVELLDDVIRVFDPDESGGPVTPLILLGHIRQQMAEDLKADPELFAELLGVSLSRIYSQLGHQEEALVALDKAQGIMRSLHPEGHAVLAKVLLNKGTVLDRMGDYPEAEAFARQALDMRQRLKMTDKDLAGPMINLATSLAHQGRPLEVPVELYRQGLDLLEGELGPKAHELVRPLRNLGKLEFTHGDTEKAERLLRRALRIGLAKDSKELDSASVRSTLGRVLTARGQLDAAERELSIALAVRREKLENDHISIARAEKNLAAVLIATGELATAEVLLAHAQSALRRERRADHWEIAELESLLGELWLARGRYSEAEPCLVESYRTIETERGPEAIYTQQALARVIQLFDRWGRPSRAAAFRTMASVRQ